MPDLTINSHSDRASIHGNSIYDFNQLNFYSNLIRRFMLTDEDNSVFQKIFKREREGRRKNLDIFDGI